MIGNIETFAARIADPHALDETGWRGRDATPAKTWPASAAAATVFARAEFQPVERRGAGGDRPQRRRQIVAAARCSPACCASLAGQLALAGGDDEATLAEQSHYLGHLDAVKPSLSVGENLQFWAAYLGAPRGTRRSAGAGGGRSRPSRRLAGGLSLGRTEAAPVDCPAGRGQAADLAAGRADLGARRAIARPAGRPDARPSRRRRHDRRGGARADRA